MMTILGKSRFSCVYWFCSCSTVNRTFSQIKSKTSNLLQWKWVEKNAWIVDNIPEFSKEPWSFLFLLLLLTLVLHPDHSFLKHLLSPHPGLSAEISGEQHQDEICLHRTSVVKWILIRQLSRQVWPSKCYLEKHTVSDELFPVGSDLARAQTRFPGKEQLGLSP